MQFTHGVRSRRGAASGWRRVPRAALRVTRGRGRQQPSRSERHRRRRSGGGRRGRGATGHVTRGRARCLLARPGGRWGGALFALNLRNPDAARHFCTSARECIVTALDIAAPDDVVKRELASCEFMDDGRLMRRSKLKYLLVRKGLADDAVEEFVNEDVEDILRLFRVFNDGTHGAAGRFSLDELVAVKQRAESGIWFLHTLWQH